MIITICELATLLRIINLALRLREAYLFLSGHAGKQRWAFIGDNFLSIIVIAQNSLDLSITVIAFVEYFVIADKLSR